MIKNSDGFYEKEKLVELSLEELIKLLVYESSYQETLNVVRSVSNKNKNQAFSYGFSSQRAHKYECFTVGMISIDAILLYLIRLYFETRNFFYSKLSIIYYICNQG